MTSLYLCSPPLIPIITGGPPLLPPTPVTITVSTGDTPAGFIIPGTPNEFRTAIISDGGSITLVCPAGDGPPFFGNETTDNGSSFLSMVQSTPIGGQLGRLNVSIVAMDPIVLDRVTAVQYNVYAAPLGANAFEDTGIMASIDLPTTGPIYSHFTAISPVMVPPYLVAVGTQIAIVQNHVPGNYSTSSDPLRFTVTATLTISQTN